MAAPYGSHFFGSLVKSDYLIIHKRTIGVTERRLGRIDMGKRYLLYKFCRDGDRHLITWLTASGLDEANLAVKLLRKNHPQVPDLVLGEGDEECNVSLKHSDRNPYPFHAIIAFAYQQKAFHRQASIIIRLYNFFYY